MMRTAWKKQNSIGNCPAKNSEISEFSENSELSPWPSSSLRKKKINRVDNPFSEYYKKPMCDLEIYLRKGSEDKSRDYTDVQSLNLTASILMIFHATQNHKKVMSHGFHANLCSAYVA